MHTTSKETRTREEIFDDITTNCLIVSAFGKLMYSHIKHHALLRRHGGIPAPASLFLEDAEADAVIQFFDEKVERVVRDTNWLVE